MRCFVRFLLCAVLLVPLAAQEEEAPGPPLSEEGASEEASVEDIESSEGAESSASPFLSSESQQALVDELEETDYGDLVLWAQDLGLSIEGSREELIVRLRQRYDIDERLRAASDPVDSNRGTIITIDSADSLENFTIEEYSEQYLRLGGRVRITMEDRRRAQTHRIEASSIVLNQETKSLTARGDIVYTLEQQGQRDIFTGDSLTVDVDTWEGVFLGGVTEMSPDSGDQDSFFFRGEVVTRSAGSVVIFEDVTIFSQNVPNPYYSIAAKKLWMLAPDEWAVLHPVLKLGHIPVFYLPFFFQNGDRLFFRPAIGMHSLYGYFIHTTTYIYGQPTEDGGSGLSVLQIASQRGNQKKVIDGLFLRSPNEGGKEKEEAPSNWMLKFMLDGYQHHGFYMASEGSFPGLGVQERYAGLSPFSFRFGVAFTRVLFNTAADAQQLVPYDDALVDHWSGSYLFSAKLPFRYEFEFDLGWQHKGFDLDLSAELYSDRYMQRDFHSRSESFDWNFALSQGEVSLGTSSVSSFNWYLSSRYAPAYENATLRKYLNFSVSRFSMELLFGSKSVPNDFLPPVFSSYSTVSNPEQYFFYPSTLTAPDAKLSLSGTLVDYQYGVTEQADRDEELSYDADAVELYPPWDEVLDDVQTAEQISTLPPLLEAARRSGETGSPFTFNLGYQISPQMQIEVYTDSDEWQTAEDLKPDSWEAYTRLNTYTSASLSYSLSFFANRLTLSNVLSSAISVDTLLSYREDALSDVEISNLRERFAQNSRQSLSHSLSASLSPFTGFFERSAFRYNLTAKLLENSFVEMQGEVPRFELEYATWDDDFVSTHSTGMDISFDVLGSRQSLSLFTTLPPLESIDLSLNASIVTGPVTSSLSTAFRNLAEEVIYDPLIVQSTYRQGNFLTLSQRFRADLEQGELNESFTSLSLRFLDSSIVLGASFGAERSVGYSYNLGTGKWDQEEEETLRPRRASVDFDIRYKVPPFWKNRINLSFFLDSSLSMDLLRFVNSELSFRYGFDFSIYKSIVLSFSATVRNTLLYRYVPSLAEQVGLESRDFFTDLGYAFNVASVEDLRKSFFKLQNISLRLTQDLGAWDFGLSYTGSPKLDGASYVWNNVVSFYVNWSIIEELRSGIEVDGDDFTLTQ